MQSIFKDIPRNGTFSSSQNWKLTKNNPKGDDFGKVAKEYIEQVKKERRIGRAIKKEFNSRPTDWGKLCEGFVFDNKIEDINYSLVSQKRLVHPLYEFWTGAPDLIKNETVVDIKCPYDMETFINKIDALNAVIETYKKEFEEDYWQHISNSILLESNGFNVKYFEAVIYCPYKKDLNRIRNYADALPEEKKSLKFVIYTEDEMLPYIPDDCKEFKDLNIFNFEVPKQDQEFLTERIIKAGKLLN